jgi:hypothetical protein
MTEMAPTQGRMELHGSVVPMIDRTAENPPPLVWSTNAEQTAWRARQEELGRVETNRGALERTFQSTSRDGKPLAPDRAQLEQMYGLNWLERNRAALEANLHVSDSPESESGSESDTSPTPWAQGQPSLVAPKLFDPLDDSLDSHSSMPWAADTQPGVAPPEFPPSLSEGQRASEASATGDRHWLNMDNDGQKAGGAGATGDDHWRDMPPPANGGGAGGPTKPGSTCALNPRSCWRASLCSDLGAGCSSCFVPRTPQLRAPQRGQRPPPRPRLSGLRMAATCGRPPPLRPAFSKRGEDALPPPPQLDLVLNDQPSCACNCSFVHQLCCRPEVEARRGVILDGTVLTEGVIEPGAGHCCNGQTGDMEPLQRGKRLVGESTMCS